MVGYRRGAVDTRRLGGGRGWRNRAAPRVHCGDLRIVRGCRGSAADHGKGRGDRRRARPEPSRPPGGPRAARRARACRAGRSRPSGSPGSKPPPSSRTATAPPSVALGRCRRRHGGRGRAWRRWSATPARSGRGPSRARRRDAAGAARPCSWARSTATSTASPLRSKRSARARTAASTPSSSRAAGRRSEISDRSPAMSSSSWVDRALDRLGHRLVAAVALRRGEQQPQVGQTLEGLVVQLACPPAALGLGGREALAPAFQGGRPRGRQRARRAGGKRLEQAAGARGGTACRRGGRRPRARRRSRCGTPSARRVPRETCRPSAPSPCSSKRLRLRSSDERLGLA